MKGNSITIFLFHIDQSFSLNQTKLVTVTIISEAWLKSLYSRSGFKVIKDYDKSTNFEEDCKWFHSDSVKPKALQKQTIGLQFYTAIPRRVTILHDNLIDLNENRDVFKDLNEVPTSYD